MTKSVTSPEELGGLASQVTADYSQLALQGRLAAATAEPEEVRERDRAAQGRPLPAAPVSCILYQRIRAQMTCLCY